MLRIAVTLGLGLLVACGGRAIDGGSDNDDGDGGSPRGKTTPLPECELGASPAGKAPCPWFANSLCYATKEAACACVCPTDRASTCSSGLPGGPDGMVDVQCY